MSDPGFRITVIHAIVGIGDDDEEGVPAFFTEMGPLPLIAADEQRINQIREMGQRIADDTGQTFKIVRFSIREDIGEIRPRGKAH